jgi:general secretion pathway protein B
MSFILDALKKSESDRQRQSGPSLFEVKVAPPRRRLPIWAAAIAALLVINVVVVSWMLLRHPAAQKPAAESAPAPAAQAPAATALAPGFTPGSAGRAGSEAPAAGLAPGARPGADNALPQTGAGGSPAKAAVTQSAAPAGPTAPASKPPGSGADQDSGPTFASGNPSDYAPAVEPAGTPDPGARAGTADELPLYQQIVSSADLPPLHLDLHVYAERPQDRFAMINMHRVGEGDTLPSGPEVEAIRPDGVVLSYHGTRFLLPRN